MKSLCTLPIAELHKYAPNKNMIIMTLKLYISFFEILIICQFLYFYQDFTMLYNNTTDQCG